MSEFNNLRFLDITDLLVLKGLLEGFSTAEISRQLNITQPAISQRLNKMRELVFTDQPFYYKGSRRLHLTEYGKSICRKSIEALFALESLFSS